MPRRTAASIAIVLLPALLALGLTGCFNPFKPNVAPNVGISSPPPVPNTAQKVVELFAWCWNNRDINEYSEIFTDDFQFVFALGDSAGNQFRDDPVDREEELGIARNLFVGGGSEPPANRIVLTIDPTLRALPDSRPGKDPGWHKEIVTTVDLSISTDSNEYRITGNARFFVVRGDSAKIPPELVARGFGPDPNRWYIEQWNDETLPGASAQAAIAPDRDGRLVLTSRPGTAAANAGAQESVTWGWIASLYSPRFSR